MEGFRTLEIPSLQVNAGDKRSLGVLTIEVGALAETVTVTARVTELQAKSAERSFSVEGEAVQSIAVNGRSFFALAYNAAGIVNTAATAGALGAQSNSMNANGMRANQNNVQIDGITSMDTGSNQGPSVSLSVDAVQEIKVLTSNYQAEYGRSAGAQITAVTKSGGKDFHGSVYFVRRNDDMNANTWFNNRSTPAQPTPPLEQRDIGYSIGGPVSCRAVQPEPVEAVLLRQPGIPAPAHRADRRRSASACPPTWNGAGTSRSRATVPASSTRTSVTTRPACRAAPPIPGAASRTAASSGASRPTGSTRSASTS